MKKSLQYKFFPLLLVIACLIFQLTDITEVSLFRYQRDDILSWQVWRLFSGHFIHANWIHFLLNITALIIIWFLFKDVVSQHLWWLLVLGSLSAVDIGLLVFNPEINWYVGLSGILHGLYAAGAILTIYKFGIQGVIYLILLLSKLIFEQFNGSLPGTNELNSVYIVTDAHLYGAIGGTIVILLCYVRKHSLSR